MIDSENRWQGWNSSNLQACPLIFFKKQALRMLQLLIFIYLGSCMEIREFLNSLSIWTNNWALVILKYFYGSWCFLIHSPWSKSKCGKKSYQDAIVFKYCIQAMKLNHLMTQPFLHHHPSMLRFAFRNFQNPPASILIWLDFCTTPSSTQKFLKSLIIVKTRKRCRNTALNHRHSSYPVLHLPTNLCWQEVALRGCSRKRLFGCPSENSRPKYN